VRMRPQDQRRLIPPIAVRSPKDLRGVVLDVWLMLIKSAFIIVHGQVRGQ